MLREARQIVTTTEHPDLERSLTGTAVWADRPRGARRVWSLSTVTPNHAVILSKYNLLAAHLKLSNFFPERRLSPDGLKNWADVTTEITFQSLERLIGLLSPTEIVSLC